VTTTPSDHSRTDSPLIPPPGCPAHSIGPIGPGGVRRLYGPEAEADPVSLYNKLRAEHGTVAPVLVPGDLPAWLVLGYAENLEVMRTPSRFSRDSRRWTPLAEGRVALDSPLQPIVAWQPMCTFADGEEHERLRKAVTESMGRFDRRGIRRYVVRFANQLVDGFTEDGNAELVKQFAEHLPMLTMTQVVGMPDEYGPRLVDAARDMLTGTETAVASNEYVVETLRQLVSIKRSKPANDFASWLVEHPVRLTDDEAVAHLRLVLIAAYESTANLISNTLRMVLTDPRFRASLAGGHMTLPEAVEQVLWDAPPFWRIYGRWATGDTEFADKKIKAGDMMILGLAAGNIDPAIRPDLSVPVHGNRSHLAFSGGPHECPGQEIGRAIADTGIDALLMRLPDIRLTIAEGELRWENGLMARRLTSLPVEFTPRKPEPEEQSRLRPVPPTVPEPLESVPGKNEAPVSANVRPRVTTWWHALTRWWRAR
jgi:cytochrome P450